MKEIQRTMIIGLASVSFFACQTPKNDKPTEAKIFAQDVISTGKEFGICFDPTGKEVYFTRGGGFLKSEQKNGAWSAPEPVLFSEHYANLDPLISPDGSKLYFMSNRPITGVEKREETDIWVMEKSSDGWSEPRNLGQGVNSDTAREGFASVTRDGTLYFFSERKGGMGSSDIYRCRYVGGEYSAPENLGPTINTEHWDGHPYIAPDETFMIFYSNMPGGYGEGDLYLSYNSDGVWTAPENLGPAVNTEQYEITPYLSPDQKYLYFARIDKDKKRNIFYVDVNSTPLKLE